MRSITPAIATPPHVDETPEVAAETRARRSRVAEAWRIAMAHMQLGEIPIEQLDIADPLPSTPAEPPHAADCDERAKPSEPERDDAPAKPSESDIDDSVDDSFPASDPPSWPKSHA